MQEERNKKDKVALLEQTFPQRMDGLGRLLTAFGEHNQFPAIDSNGRLYPHWSRMPEPIRHFASYDGERLVSADIKNSHPFHQCELFNPKFWGKKALKISLKSIDPWLYDTFEKTGVLEKSIQHVKSCRNSPDVQLHIQLASSGQLYEHLVEQYGSRFRSLSTRQAAKKAFMLFMNFNLDKKNSSKYSPYRAWAEDFPNVSKVYELVKSEDYTFLANLLQAFEAKMLLQLVAGSFAKKHPSVLIGSVHDSLITLESRGEELHEQILEVYQRELGVPPQVEVKRLHPDNAYLELDKYVRRKMSGM